jgi:hypothetical protein
MDERQTWGTLPPFKQAALPRFPGMLAALGPGVIFLALAQGSGELIWWPYIIAKYGLTFLFILVPACSSSRSSMKLAATRCSRARASSRASYA